jgi:hypothetical protein
LGLAYQALCAHRRIKRVLHQRDGVAERKACLGRLQVWLLPIIPDRPRLTASSSVLAHSMLAVVSKAGFIAAPIGSRQARISSK